MLRTGGRPGNRVDDQAQEAARVEAAERFVRPYRARVHTAENKAELDIANDPEMIRQRVETLVSELSAIKGELTAMILSEDNGLPSTTELYVAGIIAMIRHRIEEYRGLCAVH